MSGATTRQTLFRFETQRLKSDTDSASYSDGMISVLELGTYLNHHDPRNFAYTRTLNSIRDVPNSKSPWTANLASPFIHEQCNFQRTKNSVGANRTRKNGNWQKKTLANWKNTFGRTNVLPTRWDCLIWSRIRTDWILFFRVLRNLTEEWMMKCSVTQTRRTKEEKQKSCCWCLQNHPLPVGERCCVRRNQITKKLCQHLTYNKTQCDNTLVHHRVITWAVNELVTLENKFLFSDFNHWPNANMNYDPNIHARYSMMIQLFCLGQHGLELVCATPHVEFNVCSFVRSWFGLYCCFSACVKCVLGKFNITLTHYVHLRCTCITTFHCL